MSNKDAIISIRLPYELDQRLIEAATRLDLTKNDIARHAIRAAVAAIEANGFLIAFPLEMAVKKAPLRSTPLVPSSTAEFGLNEKSAKPYAKKKTRRASTQKKSPTSMRVALRKMIESEKSKNAGS